MRKMNIGTALAIALFLGACSQPETASEWWQKAQSAIDGHKGKKAVKYLGGLLKEFPDDVLAPRAQFQLAEVYLNNLREPKKAIKEYDRTFTDYSDSEWAPKALFMVGFVSANHTGDLAKAKTAYEQFREKYPDHLLTASVNFELKNLGVPVEEISDLKEFIYEP